MPSLLLLLLVAVAPGQAAVPEKTEVASPTSMSDNMDDQIAHLRDGLKSNQGKDRLKALLDFTRFVQKRHAKFPVEIVGDLLPLIEDSDETVRPVSVKILGRIPTAAEKIVPAFDERLKKVENARGPDGLAPDRDSVLTSLGGMAQTSTSAVEILGDLLLADAALANLPGLKTLPKPAGKPLSKQDEAAAREIAASARAELGPVLGSLAHAPRLSVKYLPTLLAVLEDKTTPGRDYAMYCLGNVDDIGRHVQATKALKTIRDTEKSAAADFVLRKIKDLTEAKANAARGGK